MKHSGHAGLQQRDLPMSEQTFVAALIAKDEFASGETSSPMAQRDGSRGAAIASDPEISCCAQREIYMQSSTLRWP